MDFWAGYLSGAAGILIGNPLDIIKTRLQAGHKPTLSSADLLNQGVRIAKHAPVSPATYTSLFRGAAAPILGYGVLNGILFASYNRTLHALNSSSTTSSSVAEESPHSSSTSQSVGWKVFTAGAVGGLTTFVVSAPTELVKCRTQVQTNQVHGRPASSSWAIAKQLWKEGGGLRGLYLGGGATSIRDTVGYGFYFWAYESITAKLHSPDDTSHITALKVLISGGLAGCASWSSIFPLDVIKTRLQTQPTLVRVIKVEGIFQRSQSRERLIWHVVGCFGTISMLYHAEGLRGFFRGFWACNLRAFVVNAVQWSVYEAASGVLITENI